MSYITTSGSLVEEDTGAIKLEAVKYSCNGDYARKVIVWDDRASISNNGWGKIIFEGTLKDLIERLTAWQVVTA